MKEAKINVKEGGDIALTIEEPQQMRVVGAGPTINDAAGWVMYHLQRHIDETRELFERMGLKPTPLAKLTPDKGA